jgi:hypothetical protein
MSTEEMREQVHQLVNEIDERLLKAVYALLSTYTKNEDELIEGYDLDGNPMSAEQLMDKYEAGLAEVKAGNYVTVEELREKSKQ